MKRNYAIVYAMSAGRWSMLRMECMKKAREQTDPADRAWWIRHARCNNHECVRMKRIARSEIALQVEAAHV